MSYTSDRLKSRTDAELLADTMRVHRHGKKFCRQCQTVKPIKAFSRDKTRHDGLQGTCMDCVHSKYWLNHPKAQR